MFKKVDEINFISSDDQNNSKYHADWAIEHFSPEYMHADACMYSGKKVCKKSYNSSIMGSCIVCFFADQKMCMQLYKYFRKQQISAFGNHLREKLNAIQSLKTAFYVN